MAWRVSQEDRTGALREPPILFWNEKVERGRANKADQGGRRGAPVMQPWLRHCPVWTALCSTVREEEHGIFVCTERHSCRQTIVSGTKAGGKRRVPGKAPERKAEAQPRLHCRAHLVAAGRVKRFGPAKERGKENLRAPVSVREKNGGIERGFKPRAREQGKTRLADAPQAERKDYPETGGNREVNARGVG